MFKYRQMIITINSQIPDGYRIIALLDNYIVIEKKLWFWQK